MLEVQRQLREAEEKHEAIANQGKLTHSNSEMLAVLPFSSYINHENTARNRSTENIPEDTVEGWRSHTLARDCPEL
ncbi:MAG: hypothetical protein PUP93_11390 [Rhizonema sp. NSF051]|nr:hypothetical protein [Rhizonema sp. NSF051]